MSKRSAVVGPPDSSVQDGSLPLHTHTHMHSTNVVTPTLNIALGGGFRGEFSFHPSQKSPNDSSYTATTDAERKRGAWAGVHGK